METYLPLKKKLLSLAGDLQSEIESLDPHLLKTLRYRAETLSSYEHTPSPLANLLQLVLLLVGAHLDGLASYFSVLGESSGGALCSSISTDCSSSLNEKETLCFSPESPFEFMLEFTVRYRQFRNCVFDLEVRASSCAGESGLRVRALRAGLRVPAP